MKMKKICALVLTMALTTAAVTGCGSSKKEDAASSAPESGAAASSAAQESEAPAAVSEMAKEAASAVESIAEGLSDEAREAVSVIESAAEEAADQVEEAAEEAESLAETSADQAESLAETSADQAESLAEDITESMAEELPDRAAAAEEKGSFAEVWQQISEALLKGYAQLRAIPEAMSEIAPVDSACRISLDPDALNILGLASETMLKTDLSWVEEIGIDVVSVTEEYERPNYALYNPASGTGVVNSTYMAPGLSAVLHVNGTEIVTADALMDEANQMFRLRLPELVSGEYMDMSSMQEYISSIRQAASESGLYFNSYTPMNTAWQIRKGLVRLLPETGLVRDVLATEEPFFESIETTGEEETVLAAGSVSEECRQVTGLIRARDVAEAARLLLDRIENDPDFREEVISYLDTYYDEFTRGGYNQLFMSAQSLMRTTGYGGGASEWLYYLNPYYTDQRLTLMTAVLTGKWEFREGAVEEAARRIEEEEEEAEENGEEESQEDAYDLRMLTVRPGMALTRAAYEALPSEQLSLLRKAIAKGDILLAEEYSFGEKLYVAYSYYAEDLRAGIEEAAGDIPENIYLELTASLDGGEKLVGLHAEGLLMLEEEDRSSSAAEEAEDGSLREMMRMPLFTAAWPEEDGNRALLLMLDAGLGDSTETGLLIEALKEDGSKKQEINASCTVFGREYFTAQILSDPDEGLQSLEAKAQDGYGDPLFDIHARHITDEESGTERFDVTAAEPGSEQAVFALNVSKTPEETKDIWTGQAVSEGRTLGSLDGYYDWANGETSFTVTEEIDEDVSLVGSLAGTIDLESGDGDLHVTVKDANHYGDYYSSLYGAYSTTQLDIDISAEGIRVLSDGKLSGKVSISGDLSGDNVENAIPKGLTLFLDLDGQSVKVGDASGTYISITALSESEYMPYARAHERIRGMCLDEDVRMRYSRRSGNGLDDNWNVLLPINRLLKAGMPQDFLKELSTNEELQEILEDFKYGMAW